MERYIFTSESVTSGHHDKICDAIADSFLDEALRQDKNSKMAVEVTIKDDLIFVYGECNTKANIDYEKIAKDYLKEIGYEENYEVLCDKLAINNDYEEFWGLVRKYIDASLNV